MSKEREALKLALGELQAGKVGNAMQIIREALAEQPAQQQEPFGYFKAEPFGWTDCAETDEGAIALYERPQPAQPSKPWIGLVHEETHEAIGTAGVDLLELAKMWSDNKVHVYQFDNEARKIIEAVLRRASAKLQEKNNVFNQCNTCNERWEAGTASTCKCLPLPDYRFNMKDAPIKYQFGKAVSIDWIMRITADRKIEVAEDVEVTEAAKKVLEAMQVLIDAQRRPLTDEMITAGARALCKQMAESCGVDERDEWQLYADTFKEDAKAVLEAAAKLREKNA